MSIDEIRKIFQVEHHHDGKFSNPQWIKNNYKENLRIYEFKINIIFSVSNIKMKKKDIK